MVYSYRNDEFIEREQKKARKNLRIFFTRMNFLYLKIADCGPIWLPHILAKNKNKSMNTPNSNHKQEVNSKQIIVL